MEQKIAAEGSDDFAQVIALERADYSQAQQLCDLVMKGGVTSGIVYPSTVCRLAKTFRFKNIGGTSAGALAAALAAAAEYARANAGASDPSAGFRKLAKVPTFLGTRSNLLDLFQPSNKTSKLFDLFVTYLKVRSIPNVVLRALRTYATQSALGALAGLAVFFVAFALIYYVVLATADSNEARRKAIVALAVVTAVLVATITACASAAFFIGRAVLKTVTVDIPQNAFGMCTGQARGLGSKTPPLTPWLCDRIDYIANRSTTEDVDPTLRPLTFGDLYGSTQEGGDLPYPATSALFNAYNALTRRGINLEMVTTDVTAGRPYRLPFTSDDETKFFFDPTEFARFFPERVIACMTGSNPPTNVRVGDRLVALLPFPEPETLPVVVAARMSMSFPILFSAIPLYAVNRKAYATLGAADNVEFRKTWFSDGGLSSNLPIHFFDGPIPRWPTFALNLRGFPRTSDGKVVPHPPASTGPDSAKVFPATEFDPDVEVFAGPPGKQLFGFLNSLLDAMRNWNDNTLIALPGYRERTVEIAMSDKEGGLNLAMDEATLKSIMSRGFYAGNLFTTEYGGEQSPFWAYHRQMRIQSSLLMQSEWMRRFVVAWHGVVNPNYDSIIRTTTGPWAYSPPQADAAADFAGKIASLPATIPPKITFTNGPLPAPELRARPRV